MELKPPVETFDFYPDMDGSVKTGKSKLTLGSEIQSAFLVFVSKGTGLVQVRRWDLEATTWLLFGVGNGGGGGGEPKAMAAEFICASTHNTRPIIYVTIVRPVRHRLSSFTRQTFTSTTSIICLVSSKFS